MKQDYPHTLTTPVRRQTGWPVALTGVLACKIAKKQWTHELRYRPNQEFRTPEQVARYRLFE